MASIKILCTADLHLGRSTTCFEKPSGVDTSATGAWLRVVDAAIEGRAATVAIAGDVFEGLGLYFESRREFAKGLNLLAEAGIPVVAVAGNHDFEALLRFDSHYGGHGFHLLGKGGNWDHVELHTSSGPITFLGWSFAAEKAPTSALGSVPKLQKGHPVVGVLHGDIAPGTQHNPLREEWLAGSADAWVLGHIHLPSSVGANAHYPGSPQALDSGWGERGVHGFKWLEIEVGRASFSEVQPISTVRFEIPDLDVFLDDGEEPWSAIIHAAEERASGWRVGQPHLRTVQIRATVALTTVGEVKMRPRGSCDLLSNDDVLLVPEVQVRTSVDPWNLIDRRDASGEVARLLLGARSLEPSDSLLMAEESWVASANKLISQGAEDAQSHFTRTIARASDGGDGERTGLSDSEASGIARKALIAELERLLQELVVAEEAA